jgi:UDP-N-acetylmuramate--alanine ligase
MFQHIKEFNSVFFIGIAGTGMSALAQYLQGSGKSVSGSDRNFIEGEFNDTLEKLKHCSISCYQQDGSGLHQGIDLVVVSTAIEETVPEVKIARELSIPIIKRSELLAMIAADKKTIAVGGTSGKSTTCAMLFDILSHAGMAPGIISGAGLTRLIKQHKIGNAHVGNGEWLIIEADESDGSIVNYHPEIGVLLNVDKDHQDIDELLRLFDIFRQHTKDTFIVNLDNPLAASCSAAHHYDFSANESTNASYKASDFHQQGMDIKFRIHHVLFNMHALGRHNMENALAAVAVGAKLGVSLEIASEALKNYEGIYRRHQYLGNKNGLIVIDDYAHNPVKCAASIKACQPLAKKIIAWFQPHGYGPTRFLKQDFIKEFTESLREEDELWMSEIYYAGGTAVKDISSNDLVTEIQANGKKAFFVEDRLDLLESIRPHFTDNCVLLLMGARDPSLESFTHHLFHQI